MNPREAQTRMIEIEEAMPGAAAVEQVVARLLFFDDAVETGHVIAEEAERAVRMSTGYFATLQPPVESPQALIQLVAEVAFAQGAVFAAAAREDV